METPAHGLLTAIRKYRSILILIKGSPDPDAIASSYAMSVICRAEGIESAIVAETRLSLPQNRAFVSLLDIPLRFAPIHDSARFNAYLVTDHQSAAGGELAAGLPCAAHIDHHEPGGPEVNADFSLRDTDAGSTCTIVALILRELALPLDPKSLASVATALLYGIYTDTDKYSHAGARDYEALDYLSQHADHSLFTRISSIPISKETLGLLKNAIAGKIEYRDWLIAGIGYVDASHRDSIAIIADFMLRREKFSTVIVFAIIEDRGRGQLSLDASFRSSSETMDLNGIIKRITPEGGARRYKGAYRIGINYFTHAPDRHLLWEVVRGTTLEVLKKSRDEILVTEVRSLYQKFRRGLRRYLGQ